MERWTIDNRKDKRSRTFLPIVVLLCGFAATIFATYLIKDNFRVRNQQHATDGMHLVERTIETRMETYLGLLRGGAGLFAANQFVTIDQFRRFFQRIEVIRRYPGIQGIGYTVHFPPEKLDGITSMVRAQGLTNFTVWPPGPREEYHTIVFLEPLDRRNQQAIGYDMFTETTRRAAMSAARDTGAPAISGIVRLVQEFEGETGQPGFLLYLPLYLGGNVPETIPQRRSQLQGFVYSPFRASDLFDGMFAGQSRPHLPFAVWDGTELNPDTLLYESTPGLSERVDTTRQISAAGRSWTIGYHVGQLESARGTGLILFFLITGVIGSMLLGYLTWTEGKARLRSEQAAHYLANQHEWLQVTLSSIADAVISTDTSTCIQFMNTVAEHLTGWKLEEAKKKPLAEVFSIVHEETGANLPNPAEQVLATGRATTLASHALLKSRNGAEWCIDDSAAPIKDHYGNNIGVVLVFREINDRRRFERRSTAQHAVTRALVDAPNLSDAAARVLSAIGEHLRFDVGVFWKIEEDGRPAEPFAIWRSPSRPSAEFDPAPEGFNPASGGGLPHEVWKSKQALIVGDFAIDRRFPRAEEARKHGLQSAIAFPITSETDAFGVVEYFSRERLEPDDELQNVALGLGAQIGQYIQRKRVEQRVAESESLYRAISETAADGIVVTDENSIIVTVNEAVERMFGYSASELVGQNLTMLMPPRMRERHNQGMARFLRTGKKNISWNGVELPGLHRDGREIPLEISFGMAQRSGRYLFTGLMRDITRRKEAETRLRETEERFALLVRLAEEYAIIIMGPEGEITTWNPGAERIFGYTDEEVLGRDNALFYADEDQAQHIPEKQLEKARQEGRVLDERWQVRKDGSKFWASGSLICLRGEDDAVRGFAKILRDITQRKQAEEAIRELNQELELRVQRRTSALHESKEQMEAFSYTVAHDLRAPLRAMQGFSQALLDDYAEALEPSAQDYLRRIMASAERMDELIQDLLAYSQLSRSDLNYRIVSVPEMVRNALRQLEVDIKESKAEISTALDDLYVYAHSSTLEHAIANLIANAIKFTSPSERPSIRIRAIDQGSTVQISVQDNGIGIAPEHHDRIFRVFERLHNQHAYPGTGIGLAIVKKGVERMNGRIGVVSEPGRGSIFWIELPKADPTA